MASASSSRNGRSSKPQALPTADSAIILEGLSQKADQPRSNALAGDWNITNVVYNVTATKAPHGLPYQIHHRTHKILGALRQPAKRNHVPGLRNKFEMEVV